MNEDLTLVNAGSRELSQFVQSWVPCYWAKKFADSSWQYRMFLWDQAIRLGLTYAAVTDGGDVEGMIAVDPEVDALKVIYLAAAPWNYGSSRIRSGIGSSLISNAIAMSRDAGFGGALELASVPEAESFYQKLNFVATGQFDRENLPIYRLDADAASQLLLLCSPFKHTQQRSTG